MPLDIHPDKRNLLFGQCRLSRPESVEHLCRYCDRLPPFFSERARARSFTHAVVARIISRQLYLYFTFGARERPWKMDDSIGNAVLPQVAQEQAITIRTRLESNGSLEIPVLEQSYTNHPDIGADIEHDNRFFLFEKTILTQKSHDILNFSGFVGTINIKILAD